MKNHIVFVLLFIASMAIAQNTEPIQKEIDHNLWKPFQSAFENLDAKKLNALYAEEVLRVTPAGIDTENRFKDDNVERLENHKRSNTNLRLDFWFDSRKTNETSSYEVGFYRMRLTNAKEVNTIYGQFHIVLEKIDGIWKITQDWDTDKINGKDISKEDFEKQEPIQFE